MKLGELRIFEAGLGDMEKVWLAALIVGAVVVGIFFEYLRTSADRRFRQNALDAAKIAMSKGQEVPKELLDAIAGTRDSDPYGMKSMSMNSFASWNSVVLFLVMAAAFGAASLYHPESHAAPAFQIVAAVMGVSGVVAAIATLTRRKNDG